MLHITRESQNKSMTSHLSEWKNISFDNISNISVMKMQNATTPTEKNLVTSREITYASLS